MGPSSADFALLRLASCPVRCGVAIDMLLTSSCPSTPSPRLIRSKVSTVDLRRAPARCSIRPSHCSKMAVAVCSRNGATHGLFMTSPCRPGMPPQHSTQLTRCKTAFTAPGRFVVELYSSALRAWINIRAQSELMARAVPVSHLHLAPCGHSPDRCCNRRGHRGVERQDAFVGR
jgi:hypothetical protein